MQISETKTLFISGTFLHLCVFILKAAFLEQEILVVEFDQIIKGCRQYNKFAQKMLYEMFAPQMHGLCFRYIGDSETTKDIVQEGFIKVFSNIKKFKGKGSFEGWIKRIFINTAISYIRKNSKNQLKLITINE